MSRTVAFDPNGWEDYVYWQTQDRKTLKRIKHLAVDQHTSVSAWVSDLVTRTVDEMDGFSLARKRALAYLQQPAVVADATTLSREQAHER